MKASLLLKIFALAASAFADTLPTDDDFYTPPSGYESEKPGAVLKTREVASQLSGFTNMNSAYQLLFRSTDTNGDAIAAVTTVMIPKDAQMDQVLSYFVPEDASYIGCAPSYIYSQKGESEGKVQDAIDAGIIVNVPDHQGPNSAFTAGHLEAQISLDSIRALNSVKEVDFDNAKFANWGYSGGSIPAGWSAELAPTYAPELNLVGTAMGGVVANLTGVFVTNNAGLTAGFIPPSIWGLSTEYEGIKNIVDNKLVGWKQWYLEKAKSQCSSQNILSFLFQNIYDYFEDGDQLLYLPEVKKVMDSLTMGSNTPQMPMYIYQGTSDNIVNPEGIYDAVEKYCDNDATLLFTKVDSGNHLSTESDMASDAFDWLKNVLSTGDSGLTGCKTVNSGDDKKSKRAAAASTTNVVYANQEEQAKAFIKEWNEVMHGHAK